MTLKRLLFTSVLLCFFSFGPCTALLAQNSPAPIKLVEFILKPDSPDWTYTTNEVASVEISVLKFDLPLNNVTVSYEIGPEMLPAEKKGSLLLKNGMGKIIVGTSKNPGFRQLTVRTNYEGKTYSDMIKLGFSPEKIQPTVKLPDDFSAFWKKGLEESAAVPLDPVLTPLPQFTTAKVDVYLVKLQNYKRGQHMYGFLCKPKAPGKYPVLFSPPGAGVKPVGPDLSFAERGFISLNIEIHGISPLLDASSYKDISNAFGSYWFNQLADKDNYYYRKVYLGCSRAVDFLCSLPGFDGKNVVVTGGSQGGALSIVTAALNKKVTCFAAFYPALCDLTGYLHGRAGGWPHLFNAVNSPVTHTSANLNTIGYYDVVNFARQISVPGFYSFGYNDNTCPPTSVLSAINSVKAPREVVVTPISGHWRFGETNEKSIEWINQHLSR